MIEKLLEDIIAREFRVAAKLEQGAPVAVKFTEDETIEVRTGGDLYVMEIGSDDDYFWFRKKGAEDIVVRFDYPKDWPEV